MISKIVIKYKGAVPDSRVFSVRAMNEVKRKAWLKVGRYWHEHFREKHFTHEGAAEYHYTPRSGEQSGLSTKQFFRSYTGRKQRYKGHTLPLVWSGDPGLRAMSRIASITATATSTRSGCRIALPQANKANFKNPYSQIDMRDELTRVSPAEGAVLAGMVGDELKREWDAFQAEDIIAFFHAH